MTGPPMVEAAYGSDSDENDIPRLLAIPQADGADRPYLSEGHDAAYLADPDDDGDDDNDD